MTTVFREKNLFEILNVLIFSKKIFELFGPG